MAQSNGPAADFESGADRDSSLMLTGISAGALWYCLRDLAEKAGQLPPGDVRKTWTDAVAEMMKTLDEAQAAAKIGR